jgi:CubicO group peptidase (beta-lactamase class C family)
MRIFISFIWIFILFSVCSSKTNLENQRTETKKILQTVHDKQKNVGLSAAIIYKGKLVYSEGIGFADLEFKIPVDKKTKFQVASVTKAFTGTALVKLFSEGKINLDVEIQKYVSDFPNKSKNPITLNLLAIHFGGIRHYKQNEKTVTFLNTNYADLSEAIKLFKDDELLSEPGTKYQYSSFGYNLLALAIENAAKKPFEKFVEDEIFKPLDMQNTQFNDVRFIIENRARYYSFYDPITFTPSEKILRVPDFDYSYNMGGGNIITTAEDLAKFGQAFTKAGFFEQKYLEMLYKRQRKDSPWSYGWFVPEDSEKTGKRLHITGAFPGVQACLFVYPDEDLSIAILSNTWGIGSNSGEMVSTVPEKIAEIWKK